LRILLIWKSLVISVLTWIIVLFLLAGQERRPSEPSEDGIGHLLDAFPESRGPSSHVIDVISQSLLGIAATATLVLLRTAVVHARIQEGLLPLPTLIDIDMRLWLCLRMVVGSEGPGVVGLQKVSVAVEDG
jgi:hypothetical protein